MPGPALGRTRDRRPLVERAIDRALSRRRRFDFLEGMLTSAFPGPSVLAIRRTNLTNVMLAKYEERRRDRHADKTNKNNTVANTDQH